jgi:hypothetical protein
MKESFWQIIIFFSFSVSYGQDPFVPKYKFSDEILLQLSKDTLNYRAAWDLSFIGEYQKALEIWDRDEQKWPAPLQAQVDEFKRYKPVNANKLITEKAKTEQIIILNEAHQQPYHRVFTTSLLQDLYNQGYRYFGAETIWDWDSLLNKRKYPTLKTGYYTQEPCYGNMIREAMRIGYKVFSYESTLQKSDSAGINLREVDQAKNIRKILDKDPKAKILIHCGFDHLVETPVYSWGKAMAGRLIEYTGIDPFTIDQTRFTEHSATEYENPLFKMTNLDYYAVFLDSAGRVFNGAPRHKDYDARVYHPRTNWINGRPDWMFKGNRKPYYIKDITVSFPCLVFAYLADENIEVKNSQDMPLPYDVIEIKNASDKKALSLKAGKYNIIIKDKNGQQQKISVTM